MKRISLAALILVACLAGTARAEGDAVVTVLYFDNNTGDASYDALGKGLADMMVTDLSSVPGVQVVEREKLQDVLEELKLQRSKYFDPRTAQKIGKGIGAAYAVTGALLSATPDLRIDVRVIRITTGEVVKADKVVGKKEKFFDLQQQLVSRLAEGLGTALGRAGGAGVKPQSRVDDLQTVVEYGQGLQLRDGGELASAAQHMEKVMRGAPGFALARSRYLQIMKELHASKDTRARELQASDDALLAALDKRIAGNARKLKEQSGFAINWRMTVPAPALRGELLLRRLAQALDGPAAEVRKHLETYVASQQALLEHQLGFMGTGPYAFGYGLCHDADWQFACLGKEELAWAADLGLADPLREAHMVDGHQILQDLHGLIMFGDRPFYSGVKLPRRVCLYKLDRNYPQRALDMLDRGLTLLAQYDPSYGAGFIEDETISLHIQRAMHFVVVGKPEEAVATLQSMLNRYPKSKRFAEVEGFLRLVLSGADKWPNGKPIIAACADPN